MSKSISKTIWDVIEVDDNDVIHIDYDAMYFKDSHLLSPAANHFNKHGYYCPYNKDINYPKWEEFWDTERDRCLNGYTAENGVEITGYHYFYLNYCPIDRAVDVEMEDGTTISKRKNDFPLFYDGDWLYFWLVELARKWNKHLNMLKARRKGYSYKNAAMMSRNYHLIRRSKNFALAGHSDYLEDSDALLPKVWNFISHNDEHCAWAQPRLVNKWEYKIAGYKKKINGQEVDKGFQSKVEGKSLNNNPDGVRGAAGELVLWEESGKFPELLDAWEIAMPLVKQGAKTLGLMIAFGTGGTEGADFASAEALFEKPEVYDCLAFNNIWDEGAEGTSCGFFHPNRLTLDGFIDGDGNSDMQGAYEYEQKQRELKKKGDSGKSYEQYVAEHAETPQEATIQSEANLFPTKDLQEQLNKVKANNKHHALTPGYIVDRGEEGLKFDPSNEVKPIFKYPHSRKDDVTGGILIKEGPHTNKNGHVPRGLYILCHDPYAHDSSTDSESLGAAYIIKRTNNFSPTYNECIVASYVGRPDTQDEYNRNMFRLAEYYNAKIGFENDRGDVIGYAKRHQKLGLLEEEFEMLYKKELSSSRVNRNYGMHMTQQRIDQGEVYLRDWLNTVVMKTADGKEKKVLHTIYDPALLKELIKYNKKGNFDRVRALMVGMYHNKELYTQRVAPSDEGPQNDDFFNRQYPG